MRRHLASHSRSHSLSPNSTQVPHPHPPTPIHKNDHRLLTFMFTVAFSCCSLIINSHAKHCSVCVVGLVFCKICLLSLDWFLFIFPPGNLFVEETGSRLSDRFPKSQFLLTATCMVIIMPCPLITSCKLMVESEALSDSGLTGWQWGDCFADGVVFNFLKKHLVSGGSFCVTRSHCSSVHYGLQNDDIRFEHSFRCIFEMLLRAILHQ